MVCVLAFLLANAALASYSPPLTRVRIDRDTMTHTPSVLYATDQRTGDLLATDLTAWGAQYIFQTEWERGFGVQAGAAAAYATLDLQIGPQTFRGTGYLLGAQLRAYAMLLSGSLFTADRPSALTAFVNLRAVYYSAKGDFNLDAQFHSVSAGAGLMAELALAEWISFCPYAWFSPGLEQKTSYMFRDRAPVAERVGATLRQPLRVGADVWIYYLGKGSDAHFGLSAIASLIDTEGRGNEETAIVLSYTF